MLFIGVFDKVTESIGTIMPQTVLQAIAIKACFTLSPPNWNDFQVAKINLSMAKSIFAMFDNEREARNIVPNTGHKMVSFRLIIITTMLLLNVWCKITTNAR